MKYLVWIALFMMLLSSFLSAQISATNIYYLPNSPYEYPNGIVAGPDGTLWFTTATNYTGSIGRIDMTGNFAEYPIPYSGTYPLAITVGSDGNVWFVDQGTNSIGRVVVTNSPPTITETKVPTPNAFSGAWGTITSGPDGNLWFTEGAANKIGRITTKSAVAEFPVPTVGSVPSGITAGPSGAPCGSLWFVEEQGSKIGCMTTAGVVTAEYPTLTPNTYPTQITTGADGALWFTEAIGQVGRITGTGLVTEYPVGIGYAEPLAITAGPEGSLWFISLNSAYYPALGQISRQAVHSTAITIFILGRNNSQQGRMDQFGKPIGTVGLFRRSPHSGGMESICLRRPQCPLPVS